MPQPLPPPGAYLPPTPAKKSPSAGWFALPVGLFVAALAVFVIGIAVFISALSGTITSATSGFDRISNGSEVTLPMDDSGIYAALNVRGTTCTLTDEGGTVTVLEVPSGTTKVTINGDERYLLATVPDSLAAGNYLLECHDAGPFLWTGPEVSLGRALAGIALVFVVPGVFVLAAVASLIIIVVRRNV